MISSHLLNISRVIVIEVQVVYPHLPPIFPKNYAYSPILSPIDLDLCRFETIRCGKDTFCIRLQEGVVKMRIHINVTVRCIRLGSAESEVFVCEDSAVVAG